MQKKIQCIYLYDGWMFYSAAGKQSPDNNTVFSRAHIRFHPASMKAEMCTNGVGQCMYLMTHFHVFLVHDSLIVCFVGWYLYLPIFHCLILGAQTGRPVSGTHQACGWSPSCSTDVWTGSTCHSSWQVDSFGAPIVLQHELSPQF